MSPELKKDLKEVSEEVIKKLVVARYNSPVKRIKQSFEDALVLN